MSIHDYFPQGQTADAEQGSCLRDLSAEEKQLLRRELAEYGERLAKAERKRKALEGI